MRKNLFGQFRKLTHLSLVAALVILVLGISLVPANKAYAAGSVYYVAKTGSDSNPGTEAQPWLTIDKATSMMVAGDTTYVREGIYHESVLFDHSGNSTAGYIKLIAYPGESVTVDGDGLTLMNGVISCYAQKYIWVEGLTICNANKAGSNYNGIYIGTVGAGSTDHYVIKDCIIHDTNGSGILVLASWTESYSGARLTDVLIDGNEVYNATLNGSMESISLRDVSKFEIKNNKVHDAQGVLTYGHDKEGIGIAEGCSNGLIHDNETYATRYGIYIDGHSQSTYDIDIYNNYCHDNYDSFIEGSGIGLSCEHGGGLNISDINFWNNILANNYTNGFTVLSYATNVSFTYINNTHYKNGKNRDIYLSSSPKYSNCTIQGNIIYGNVNSVLIDAANYPNGISIDKNLFYNGNSSTRYGINYITGDPAMINPDAGNFELNSSSPAIDSGWAVNAPAYDFFGNARPAGLGIDIGAVEYTNSSDYQGYVNQAPVLTAIGNKALNEGESINFSIFATDANGDTLTYAASNLPSGASFSTDTQTFSWTPAPGQTGTYADIRFEVSDGSLTDFENIVITVNGNNQAPEILAIGDKSTTIGSKLKFIVTAVDADGDALTYSASNLPSGATFDAVTHTFSWTPSRKQAGTFSNVIFTVTDGQATTQQSITITVSDSSTGNGGKNRR